MVKYPETAYIAPWFIGGNGGGDFECYANTGGIIKSIGVWSDIRDVTAVQIKFTDGEDKYKFGSGAWGDYKEYVFDVGETVKSMSLWGNGSGTNCGRIRFTTSKGTEFDSGGKRGKKEFPMDVGSGIWVGVAGRCGGSIDRLGVSFLKEVDSMSMSDVKFKNDPTGSSKGVAPKIIKSAQYPYDGIPGEWAFSASIQDMETHTVTTTISNAIATTIGLKETWKSEVNLGLAKTSFDVEATQSVSWTWTHSSATADETKHAEDFKVERKGKITSKEDAVSVTALTFIGSVDLEYTAIITVKMKNGTKYKISEKGTMKKVTSTKLLCNVTPLDEDPTFMPIDSSGKARSLDPIEDENRNGYNMNDDWNENYSNENYSNEIDQETVNPDDAEKEKIYQEDVVEPEDRNEYQNNEGEEAAENDEFEQRYEATEQTTVEEFQETGGDETTEQSFNYSGENRDNDESQEFIEDGEGQQSYENNQENSNDRDYQENLENETTEQNYNIDQESTGNVEYQDIEEEQAAEPSYDDNQESRANDGYPEEDRYEAAEPSYEIKQEETGKNNFQETEEEQAAELSYDYNQESRTNDEYQEEAQYGATKPSYENNQEATGDEQYQQSNENSPVEQNYGDDQEAINSEEEREANYEQFRQ